jgi:hypothetical protein
MTNDVKFQNFFSIFVSIKSSIDRFKKTIITFRGSEEQLLQKLDAFIAFHEMQSFEDKLIRLAIESFVGQTSLMDSFIEYIKNIEDNKDNTIMSSTMQMVYDFYLVTMMKVSEGDAMMDLCYQLQKQLTNSTDVIIRQSSVTPAFLTSMRDSLSKVDNIRHRTSFINLKKPEFEVRLKSVVQYFWRNEYEMSGRKQTCSENCAYYKSLSYNSAGCEGTIHDCEFSIGVGDFEYYYASVSLPLTS